MSQETGLRPIAGPEPVDLSSSTWWLWAIPILLLFFVWFWWRRNPTARPSTGKDLLVLALEQAGDVGLDARQRFEQLHHGLRAYLAFVSDTSWKSLVAAESLPAWQNFFHDNSQLAETWRTRWEKAEAIIFSPDSITENQVAEYSKQILELDTSLSSTDEKYRKD